MSKYTITAPNGNTITVVAKAHRQHSWDQALLLGVSAAGRKRLNEFLAKNCEWSRQWGFYKNTSIDATRYNPSFGGCVE